MLPSLYRILLTNNYGHKYFVKCNNPKRDLNPVTNERAVSSNGQQMVENGTTSLQVTGERNDKAPAANSAPPTEARGNCDGSHELNTDVIALI